ncbi:hypothetical protein A4S06_10200 [Erysipelotrichaceae bacterium MTC7]|nr:hypothetical protein A4S06_10200 [Erysipelotrichaceae bacterium MTC7]
MYTFEHPLQEARIVEKKNRFLFVIAIHGQEVLCHIPATTRIGGYRFEGAPCLVSYHATVTRKSAYTCEAIWFDGQYVGINQSLMNDVVHYYLQQGQFRDMIDYQILKREVVLHHSRIDFCLDETYLEVKMPLVVLQLESTYPKQKQAAFDGVDRLLKQLHDLKQALLDGKKVILLTCFVYDAIGFVPGLTSKRKQEVYELYVELLALGLQLWQATFSIDAIGIRLMTVKNVHIPLLV